MFHATNTSQMQISICFFFRSETAKPILMRFSSKIIFWYQLKSFGWLKLNFFCITHLDKLTGLLTDTCLTMPIFGETMSRQHSIYNTYFHYIPASGSGCGRHRKRKQSTKIMHCKWKKESHLLVSHKLTHTDTQNIFEIQIHKIILRVQEHVVEPSNG